MRQDLVHGEPMVGFVLQQNEAWDKQAIIKRQRHGTSMQQGLVAHCLYLEHLPDKLLRIL